MKSEIRIILGEGSSNKAKGNCFETLIRNLLSLHQYDIRGNINFSGMEIDLVAEQRHTRESLYVECKAKEKVTSDELSKFSFNVGFKKIDKGYFFRTQELESQAGALLREMKNRPEYKNLTFFEPNEIIQMLEDGKMIFEPISNLAQYIKSKRILAITYFGDFFIYLINESNALPTRFIVVDAKRNEKKVTTDDIGLLQNFIAEIASLLPIENYPDYASKASGDSEQPLLEAISEVQESENWHDYLPASSKRKHFVGRDDIRTKILSYFKAIRNKSTEKRIFYLNGKSGWGKSSLVLELKERCSNKHYKNKFFGIAIDTRSAISDNFVALSFKKLINSAIENEFIEKDIFYQEINFTSNNDLLSSESIKIFLDNLKVSEKFLVLIFDQFEDVFRKKDFFKTFYKFLSDVTDLKPNLIIGFSWKSDFFIQSDDPAYHIWQQAKEQTREFTIVEFGEKEIDGIIKQLEGSTGELEKGIKDRIKEGSQGLPWLTKKLCIHIYDQIQSGLAKENLVEANLNIVNLFKKDEEYLDSKELKAIKLIAKKAYDGNFFDETEVGDVVESDTIMSLLHKRLIIRSGANYNIYWDIYRDYLATGIIPLIGESYLLRQSVNLCFEVLVLFSSNEKLTIEQILERHPKGITADTLYNILIELRNLSIIQKMGDHYSINSHVEISKEGFITFITSKFQNYTPYLNLKSISKNKIVKSDVVQVLKTTFKQEFQETTWEFYANILIGWLLFSRLDIKNKIIKPVKGRGKGVSNFFLGDKSKMIPRSSLKEITEQIPLLTSSEEIINKRFKRDLLLLDIIDDQNALTDFGKELIMNKEDIIVQRLKEKCFQLEKMKTIKSIINSSVKVTSKQIIGLLPSDFFDGEKETSKIIYASKALSWLN